MHPTSRYKTVIGLIAAFVVFALGHSAAQATPVSWSAKLDSDTKRLVVHVIPTTSIKEVKVEVQLYDDQNRVVATRSFDFTGADLPILEENKNYTKYFDHRVSSAHTVKGLLLHALPVASSPKAAGAGVAQTLEKGVPSTDKQP
ncbi:MAG: hypothetical protein V2B18_13525 [Pseudomonadota bacterium]